MIARFPAVVRGWPWVGLLVLGFLAAPAHAQPSLSGVSPLAAAPGKTTEFTLSGANLIPPFSVWSSFPAQIEMPSDGENAQEQGAKKLRITLPAEAGVGLGAIVIGARDGVTEPFLLLIDDLPTAVEQDTNRALSSAQVVALPTAVDGASQAGASDFYRFTAAAGQRVAFDVYAARIGSPLDPVMWLRDASGNELAFADDDASFGADCRLSHTFAAAGDYVLEVRDNRFQAGHRYRLRMGDFPLVSASYPLAVRAGATAQVSFTTAGGEPAAGMIVVPRADDPFAAANGQRLSTGMATQRVSAPRPSGNAMGFGNLVVSTLYEIVEAEPNDGAAQAASMTAPCAVNGRFDAPGDKDIYRFAAKKGERFSIRSTSRRFGSPAAVVIRVTRLDGMAAAESAAPTEDESPLMFTAPEDGEYLAVVEDGLGLAGADRVYRVEIDRPAGFRLELKNAAPGRDRYIGHGAFGVEIVCLREGYDGPVTISAQSTSGEPLTAYNNVFAAGQKEGKVIFLTGANWTPGQARAIRIFGVADGSTQVQPSSTLALLRARWPQQAYPASWLDGIAYVGMLSKAPELYVLKAPAEAPPLAVGAVESVFTLTPERKDANFKEPLTVLLTNLPPGASYAVKREGDPPADKYLVTVTCPADLAAGDYRMDLFAYGELNGVGQKHSSQIVLHKAAP